ncbi:aspartate carbamoyltransferase catalytic subunit [Legionella waltersii]|uniref:Aspartate carbamoyltransferase n=1 Tax=Legionella waltersii TaxID=66969 RepID=A0A0W1ADH7_9GAMM|nr:aspartate carbamoyltransferase catalytic subunit [Legionella waltersii]KTD79378.1 aspartate carbamoyltransferase [Legionella waltersii]SNU99705.1 Aspartate carbamoyltransferase (Aspartate transcarbamylase) (ATCase) [Legionella waltersii]
MSHFLEISQLSKQHIEQLIQRALQFKHDSSFPNYSKHLVANLFYENSTRTRISFELAARHLSMQVVNLDVQTSSETKGEAIEDTIQNLAAMGIRYFVIRHKQEGLQQELAKKLGDSVHIVNAGDGIHAHPSQAVLDLVTIIEQKPQLEQLKIAILGNIKHSRVANSLQCICKTLGVAELVLVCPDLWKPEKLHYGRVTQDLKDGLSEADVVICLRVQRERLLENDHMDLKTYRQHFALTSKSIGYAKSNAMVMHPGPMNRGVEIDSEIADGKQSFILQQVTNGVFARMAILESLIHRT